MLQSSKGRKIQNGFDFKGIQTDALSGDDEPEKSTRFDAEDTFMRIKSDIVVSTAEKNLTEM